MKNTNSKQQKGTGGRFEESETENDKDLAIYTFPIPKHAVTILATEFINSHGKLPRGYGVWYFCPSDKFQNADYLSYSFFSSGYFGRASAAARAHFKKLGVETITVCP